MERKVSCWTIGRLDVDQIIVRGGPCREDLCENTQCIDQFHYSFTDSIIPSALASHCLCESVFFLMPTASSTTINRSSQWNFHINLKPVYLYFFQRSISMRYNPVPGMLPPLTGSMHTSRAGKQMTIIHTHARHTPIELTLTSSPPTEM